MTTGPDSPNGSAGPLLRLHSVEENITTLGPSPATVLWTQFCPIGCPGCMSKSTWSATGGVLVRPRDVARWLEGTASRFLTLSGGEPSEQADAVHALLDELGAEWIVTMYSGRHLEELRRDVRPAVRRLLQRVDVLVAGPYVQERHASLLWRGSDNQVVHDLTGRAVIPEDRTAGVAVRLRQASIEVVGVPPVPDFVASLRDAAAGRGVGLLNTADQPFPFPVLEA